MYKLSRTYNGHTQDIRGVAASGPTLFSCSRDGTLRGWSRESSEAALSSHSLHHGFVNSIATYEKLVISGGQDSIIYVVEQGQQEPLYTLVGHDANVCALATGPDALIISGSWDGTVRLWQDGVSRETLRGHEGAVWAVLHTPHGILTGGADRTIRLWKDGKQIKNFSAGKDCVRALALHPAGFLSAGNDAIIRLHTFDGEVIQQLEGHESFIYSLAVSPDGAIYSSGEDGTLRVWEDGKQVQSLKHPAVSVWAVTFLDNGDVATGTSDGILRVFSREPSRVASSDALKAFEESVAASQIPAQTSHIPNNLPGLEALEAPGKKEGEIKMIRLAGGVVEAHQWSGGVWTKVGEVVGANPARVEYEGQEYDFVFDVDIAEGAPPLKLPYNTDQNPYEAAQKFIDKYELDAGFLQQIVKFIETNTGGIALGVPKEAESKVNESAPVLQTDFLSMITGNPQPILVKLKTFFSESNTGADTLAAYDTEAATTQGFETLLSAMEHLPREQRFPALDLVRLAIPQIANLPTSAFGRILEAAELDSTSAAKDKTRETNTMLAYRCLANAYSSGSATSIADAIDVRAVSLIASELSWTSNRNLSLAQATYLLNYCVHSYKHGRPDRAIAAVEPILKLLAASSDEEVVYRSLVALSTAMQCAEEVVTTAKEIYDANATLAQVKQEQKGGPRAETVLAGLARLLK